MKAVRALSKLLAYFGGQSLQANTSMGDLEHLRYYGTKMNSFWFVCKCMMWGMNVGVCIWFVWDVRGCVGYVYCVWGMSSVMCMSVVCVCTVCMFCDVYMICCMCGICVACV